MRSVVSNLAAFAVAATLETAGCFAFWMWLRRGASPAVTDLVGASVAIVGALIVIGFAARR